MRPEDLAPAMGISPTPVKHALARLSGEGLVEFRGGQGPFVASLREYEISDIYDSRLMCEVYAIQEGIGRVDEAFLSQARLLMNRWSAAAQAADDSAASHHKLAGCDSEFHLHLLMLWPNQRTQSWYRQLNVHIRAVRIRDALDQQKSYPRLNGISSEHQAIFEALERRDAGEAVLALRRHVEASRSALLEVGQSRAVTL